MSVDAALFQVLQCPSCHGRLVDDGEALACQCGRQYPVTVGIPDFTVFGTGGEQDDFNSTQARYEAEVHDHEAETDYEEAVIRVFGTKTRLMAANWADDAVRTKAARVLDYGCGTGQLSRVFRPRFSPVHAFDISPVSVRLNVAENGVLGCVANAFFLPFHDRAFDVICINGVLHHIVDLKSAVGEIARIANDVVYVSEGVPRPEACLARLWAYPDLRTRLLYGWYLLLLKSPHRRALSVGRRLKRLAMRSKRPMDNGSGPGGPTGDGEVAFGSKYEKPLDALEVESCFRKAGFATEYLRYWTNLDYSGDGTVKRALTRALVNDKVGTHFELKMVREGSR